MAIPPQSNEDVRSHNIAILNEIRNDARKSAVELMLNVSRLTANYEKNSTVKELIRDQSRFIMSSVDYSFEDLSKHKADINNCLSMIKSTAETASEISFMKVSARLRSNRQIAAEKILITVESLRNNFAMMNYYNEAILSIKPEVPKVPNQQPAPIRVEINNSHLDLTAIQTAVGPIGPASLEKLRHATQELLDRTIQQIGSSSNIDPRLAPNLSGLKNYLSISMTEMPIEALGLNFQFARRSFSSTRETVPDALAEQIDQILSTVNVILNQYEEWRLYVSAETAIALSPTSMQAIVSVSQKVETFFEENDSLVERQLINRLREITDAYTQGLVNLESAAVPLIESLGNIFSELSRFVISQSPATTGIVGTSGAVILFLGFAIKSIETFAPTLSNFPPLSYLIDVQKFAHKQFSLIKDSIPGAI